MMNPKDQAKARNLATNICAVFQPETEREQMLFNVLKKLLECSDSQEFRNEQLQNQNSYWKSECETAKGMFSAARKDWEEKEKGFSREKQIAAQKIRDEAAKKAAAAEQKRKEQAEKEKAYRAKIEAEADEKIKEMALENQEQLDQKVSELKTVKETLQSTQEEVEKLKGQNRILKEIQNKDSHNSSKPSSTNGFKEIKNNRQKTGNKPGGVIGHPSTKKEFLVPDNIYVLDDDVYKKNPERYRACGKKKTKQLLRMQFRFLVDQVETEVYYDREKHREVTAPFPPGMKNEVTYDSSIIAFCMLLHTWGNVSYDKTRQFMSDISHGRLKIAKSTLSEFEKRFSKKTARDRDAITASLLSKPYLHVDGTPVRVNGKLMCILAITCPAGTRYYFSEHKGNEAAEKTALKYYLGVLIHDGEATFFKYGKAHQCCCEHELRYLLGISENAPELTWAKEMRKHIQNMIHTAHLALERGDEQLDEKIVKELLAKYDELIALGKKEYQEHPEIAKYSVDGVRTLNRLEKNKDGITYFLNNLEIPPTNNAAEACLRKAKMSRKQNGGFRSTDAAVYYCDSMTILETERQNGGNVYDKICSTFDEGTVPVLNEMKQAAQELSSY